MRNYQKVMHNLVMLPRIIYSGYVCMYVSCGTAYKLVADCVKVAITL